MKPPALLPAIALWLFAGCGEQKKDSELRAKQADLLRREEVLLQREQALQQREASVAARELRLDSAKTDTLHVINPAIAGRWGAQMTCTETTCNGSAVGDTKNEQWELNYQGNALVAQAKADDQLVRVYKGFSGNSGIELRNEPAVSDSTAKTTMVVRLRLVDDTHLEGTREILRENGCKIVYSLRLEKQQR